MSSDPQPVESVSAPEAKKGSRPIWQLFKYLLTAAILVFLVRQVGVHWSEIRNYPWSINPVLMTMSVLIALFAFYVFAVCWQWIIESFQHKITPTMAFRISYLSTLGRYVPGKVWQLFSMLYMARKVGITPQAAGASFVITQMFAIPASLLIAAIAVLIEPHLLVNQVSAMGPGGAVVLLIGMLALSAVVVFWPGPILRLGNWLLHLIGRQPVQFQLDKRVALKIFVGYFLGWALFGIAFWLFAYAVLPEHSLGVVAAAGVYNAAYQIGYLALFAPGGFGPRELVMGAMLSPFIGPIAPALAILSRLWSIVIEALAAVIALLIKK